MKAFRDFSMPPSLGVPNRSLYGFWTEWPGQVKNRTPLGHSTRRCTVLCREPGTVAPSAPLMSYRISMPQVGFMLAISSITVLPSAETVADVTRAGGVEI